nr:hypothetical protein [Mucilaginibacter frigoritolerans]
MAKHFLHWHGPISLCRLYAAIKIILGKVLPRRKMVAAFLFPVATAHVIGQVGIGFQVNVAGKGFTAVLALRTLVPAGWSLIGLQDKAVRVHGGVVVDGYRWREKGQFLGD